MANVLRNGMFMMMSHRYFGISGAYDDVYLIFTT